MNYIRVKTALNDESIADRLKYNPEIVEFHLVEKDLEDPERIKKYIRLVKNNGAKVYLHHPMFCGDEFLDIISQNPKVIKQYDRSTQILLKICIEEDIKCVIHAHYARSYSSTVSDEKIEKTIERINYILTFEGSERLLWENTIEGIFSYKNEKLIEKIISPLNLQMTFDVSHAFISLSGDNEKLEQVLKLSKPYINYAHVVDSMGLIHDSLPLGEGKTDWSRVKPHLDGLDFIFEIDLKESNYMDCMPMIKSGRYFEEI